MNHDHVDRWAAQLKARLLLIVRRREQQDRTEQRHRAGSA
jgi:hypothetical protein